jgi:hypothetical protein
MGTVDAESPMRRQQAADEQMAKERAALQAKELKAAAEQHRLASAALAEKERRAVEAAAEHERKVRHDEYVRVWTARMYACFQGRYPNLQHKKIGRRREKKLRLRPHASTIAPLVVFEDAFDEFDIQQILGLSTCIRELMPNHVEYQPFDQGKTGYGGGNNVTYLGGFFEDILADLTNRIIEVATEGTMLAGWLPHPRHLGIRCIELLEYGEKGELLWHQDADSVYTLTFMLGDPTDFDGGEFNIYPRPWSSRQNKTAISSLPSFKATPKQFGGVLFDSIASHAVTTLSRGKRTVLAVELWAYEHVDLTGMRPHVRYYRNRVFKPELLSIKELTSGIEGAPGGALGAMKHAMAAALDSTQNFGVNYRGGLSQFALGVAVGLASAVLLVFLFFREASPLPATMTKKYEVDEKKEFKKSK